MPFFRGRTMKCRAGHITAAIAAGLLHLPLCFLSGCQDTTPPPIQTASIGGNDDDAKMEPPTPAERADALMRLDRAIQAHGGPVRLQKLKTVVQVMKGPVRFPGYGTVQAEQELKIQLPDRLRLTIKGFTSMGVETNSLAVTAGDGWVFFKGSVRDMIAEEHQDVVGETHFRRMLTLVPLRDEEFMLRPVNGEPVAGRPTVGIRVGSKYLPPTNFYFDAETNLLVRTHGRFRDGVPQLREMRF